MADIRKNITLSAQLDDSQLRKQLEVLKKEMGNAFNVDSGSLNDLKSSIKDIAKEFGSQLRKELDGIRGPRSKGAASTGQKVEVSSQDIESVRVSDMTVANMIVGSLVVKGAGAAASASGEAAIAAAGAGGPPRAGEGGGGEGPADFFARNKNVLKLAGGAAVVQQSVSSLINIEQGIAERNNRFARDLDAGMGVEAISREAGRGRLGAALTAGGAGAITGGILGAKGGAALGSFFGPLGTTIGAGVGALGGAAAGGISSFMGTSNAVGELSKEQTQLLSDAEQRARAISPLRQQMLAGGGINRGVLTDQMMVGARQFGMGPQETLQTMLQARDVLGNAGASQSFNQIMGNQRFLGINAGTTAQTIETLAGTGGQSRSAAASREVEVLKKGVAAGLDVSKSGRFLQTTMQYLQNTAGIGKVETESASTILANLASGLAGGGPVTDVTLNQAQSLAQTLTKESSATQGLAGAANISGIQQLGQQFGGFDTGTILALSKLQKNATESDVLDILTKNTGGAQRGDLAQQVKQIQQFKGSDIMGNFIQQLAPGNLGTFLTAEEMGGTTQEALARSRATQAQAVTPETMQAAAETIQGVQEQVQQAPEFKLDVATFTRTTEEAGKGLETFTAITEQMTGQMKKLLLDLEDAQKRFRDMSRQTGYSRIER